MRSKVCMIKRERRIFLSLEYSVAVVVAVLLEVVVSQQLFCHSLLLCHYVSTVLLNITLAGNDNMSLQFTNKDLEEVNLCHCSYTTIVVVRNVFSAKQQIEW